MYEVWEVENPLQGHAGDCGLRISDFGLIFDSLIHTLIFNQAIDPQSTILNPH